jgi:hypothetical protein
MRSTSDGAGGTTTGSPRPVQWGADPRDKAASDWPAERDKIVDFRSSLTTI